MDQKSIDRINELARKQRAGTLSEAEKAEQARLRADYIAAYRRSLEAQLEQITVVEPDGSRHKLQKRRPD